MEKHPLTRSYGFDSNKLIRLFVTEIPPNCGGKGIGFHKDGAPEHDHFADSERSFVTVVVSVVEPPSSPMLARVPPAAVVEYSLHKTGLASRKDGSRVNHGSVRKVEIGTNTAYAFPGGLIQHRVYGRNAELSEGTRFTIVAFYTKSWMMIFETWTGAFEGPAKKTGTPPAGESVPQRIRNPGKRRR